MLFYLFPQSWCWSWWKCRLSKWCQHHVVDAYSGPWGVAVVFLQQGCHSNFSLVCEYILSSMKKPERMLKVSIVFLEYWLCKPAGCNFFGHVKILFFCASPEPYCRFPFKCKLYFTETSKRGDVFRDFLLRHFHSFLASGTKWETADIRISFVRTTTRNFNLLKLNF